MWASLSGRSKSPLIRAHSSRNEYFESREMCQTSHKEAVKIGFYYHCQETGSPKLDSSNPIFQSHCWSNLRLHSILAIAHKVMACSRVIRSKVYGHCDFSLSLKIKLQLQIAWAEVIATKCYTNSSKTARECRVLFVYRLHVAKLWAEIYDTFVSKVSTENYLTKDGRIVQCQTAVGYLVHTKFRTGLWIIVLSSLHERKEDREEETYEVVRHLSLQP
jgi:hypothetical protein